VSRSTNRSTAKR